MKKKKGIFYAEPGNFDYISKSFVAQNSYTVDEFRKFFLDLDAPNWNESDRKKYSPIVASFLSDYYKTKNEKFSTAFETDSLYIRIPSTIQQKNINAPQIVELMKKLLLFSKKPVISYRNLSCIDSADGWWLNHDAEFGVFRDKFPEMLRAGDVLFLPNSVLLGSGIVNNKQDDVYQVFDIRDLGLYDISLDNDEVWEYYTKDKPFETAGTLSLHFPSTTGLGINDIVEVREKHAEAFEYFLRHLKTLLMSGSAGQTDNMRNSITEIAESMRLIDSRYKEHKSKLKELRVNTTIAGTALMIGLIASDSFEVFKILSAIIGSSLVKSLIDYSFERRLPSNISDDPFFIPWQVSSLHR